MAKNFLSRSDFDWEFNYGPDDFSSVPLYDLQVNASGLSPIQAVALSGPAAGATLPDTSAEEERSASLAGSPALGGAISDRWPADDTTMGYTPSLPAPNEAGGVGLGQLLSQTFSGGAYHFSGNQDIDAVLIGSRWTNLNQTFSFPTSGSMYVGYSTPEPTAFSAFNTAQQNAARYGLSLVSSYSNLTFTEITETVATHATHRFGRTNDTMGGVSSAQGHFPTTANTPDAGDIWFNNGSTNQPFYGTPAVGNWGQATMMHEIGHTLGLKHGHDNYTFNDLRPYINQGGPSPRFGTAALPSAHDGQSWSLMTYRSNPGAPVTFQGDGFNQPQTYMQNDITGLQYMYGANFNTNSTATTYTFSTATGQMFINGAAQPVPSGNIIYRTIWDGGGNDTYDLSNYSTALNVNLNPGAFLNFGMQLANNRPLSGGPAFAPGNVANALLFNGDNRSLIENAIGGSNGDTFAGNVADNNFRGNGGNDTIDGGGGTDSAVFSGARSAYMLTALSGNGVRVTGPDGTDTITNTERLVFSDQTVIWPPSNSDDYADSLNDVSAPFGQVAVNAASTGSLEALGDQDWFRVQLTARVQYTIDLQGDTVGAGTLQDPLMQLFNGSGQLITFDDDGGGNLNSRIVYRPTTSGTYYIDAGAYNDQYTGTYRVSVAENGTFSTPPNDFNGDLRSDIFWRTNGGALAVWEMNGNQIGSADYVRNGNAVTGAPGSDWHLVGTDAMPADFDGDGKGDLLWWTDSGAVAIWKMNGSHINGADYTRLGSGIVGRPGSDWHIADTGDFDGNAKADILWRTDSGALAVWKMDGTQITGADYIRLGQTAVGAPGADWHILGVADFDGDGKGDLLWRTDSGALALWEMDGTQIKAADYLRIGSSPVGRPGADWNIVGTGDFDGDGMADILWQTNGGALALWEMDGNQIKAADYLRIGASVVGRPGADWHVAGTGDFNGDGMADILWRTDGGSLALWQMDGNQIGPAGYLKIGQTNVGAPGADWNIVQHQYDLL